MIKVSSHQPSLLPWSGYWHKVAASDLHIMTAGVQFAYGNFQNRVMLNGSWLTVPIDKRDKTALIKDVRIAEGWEPESLINAIIGRMGRPKRGVASILNELEIMSSIMGPPDQLWRLNHVMHLQTAKLLGCYKPLRVDTGPEDGADRVDRLINRIRRHVVTAREDVTYLCGQGTFEYLEPHLSRWPMGWGLQVQVPLDPDPESVLKVLATEEDPLAAINRQWTWRTVRGV